MPVPDPSSPVPQPAQQNPAGLPIPDAAQNAAASGSIPITNGSPPSNPGLPVTDGTSSPVSLPQGIAIPDDASDSDLIEKEWVLKAKDIIGQTQNNPYEQQKAISQFKANYMKKRYNKDIKLTDD